MQGSAHGPEAISLSLPPAGLDSLGECFAGALYVITPNLSVDAGFRAVYAVEYCGVEETAVSVLHVLAIA